jgi:hypothetical protein
MQWWRSGAGLGQPARAALRAASIRSTALAVVLLGPASLVRPAASRCWSGLLALERPRPGGAGAASRSGGAEAASVGGAAAASTGGRARGATAASTGGRAVLHCCSVRIRRDAECAAKPRRAKGSFSCVRHALSDGMDGKRRSRM